MSIRRRVILSITVLGLLLSAFVPTAAGRAHAAQDATVPIPTLIAGMSVEEKVGQLFWTRAYGASAHDTTYAAQNGATYGVDTAAEVVEKYHLGGVLYFAWAGNTDHPQQMAQLSNGLQEVATSTGAKVPLSLSIDQEGGIVARMLSPATEFPGNMALGATRSQALTAQQWRITGEELRATGVNTNFAPVLDVNTNPANPVIGVRSIGERPDLVGSLGKTAVAALQSENVGATLKHFPGHGDTEVDSHYGLPIVTYDMKTLKEIHLAPFKEAIKANPDAIMTAHIIVEAIDPENPATLSRAVLTGLLRQEMDYKGLIITDSLGMAGVRQKYGDDRVPVLAINAGADVLLNPPDMDTAYDAVVAAVRSGEITRARLDQSVRRVLEFKERRGLFLDPYADESTVMAHVGTPDHLAVADEISRNAATVVRNESALLPLAAGAGDALAVGPSAGGPAVVAEELSERGRSVETIQTATAPTDRQIAAAREAAVGKDLVVVTTYNGWRTGRQQRLVEAVAESGTPVVVIATRDAYDAAYVPAAEAFVATYGNRAVSVQGAVAVMFNEHAPSGKLPVTVPEADGEGTAYPYGHGLTY